MICGIRAAYGTVVGLGGSGRLVEAMRLFGEAVLRGLLLRLWRGIGMT